MKRWMTVSCAIMVAFGMARPGEAKTLSGPKKRIAVKAFKDKTNHSYRHWASVGNGMADMLATELQKTGRFVLVERNELEGALEEQKLAETGRVQAATGAQAGRLIGAAYLVTGAVTEFGIKNTKYGADKLDRLLPFGGGAALTSETARVVLDLRFMDSSTGQIIATEKAVGAKTARKVETDVDLLPSIEFGKKGFDETVIGQAAREAIEKAVTLVVKHMEKTPWHGRVARVDGASLFINTGEEDGRNVGDTFRVVRVGETLTDPDTGESLGADRETIGRIRIVKLMGKRLSQAVPLEPIDVQAGDVIEPN